MLEDSFNSSVTKRLKGTGSPGADSGVDTVMLPLYIILGTGHRDTTTVDVKFSVP